MRHGTDLLKYIFSFVIIASPSFRWFWGPPTQNHRLPCYRCLFVAYPAATDSIVLFTLFFCILFLHSADGKLLLTCISTWTTYRCGKKDVACSLPSSSIPACYIISRIWPVCLSHCHPVLATGRHLRTQLIQTTCQGYSHGHDAFRVADVPKSQTVRWSEIFPMWFPSVKVRFTGEVGESLTMTWGFPYMGAPQ